MKFADSVNYNQNNVDETTT